MTSSSVQGPAASQNPASTRPASGGRALRRWLPVGIGLLAFLIVLTAGLALTVDWGVRNAEMRRLVTAVEASEAAMGETQAAAADAFDAFDASDGGEAAKLELDSTLSAVADEGRRQIEAAAGPVAGVRILPWHGELEQARDAYLAHNRAWQDYLERAIDDPSEFDKEQVEVNETFLDAEPLMRDAVPEPALFDLDVRVATIFAPPVSEGDLQTA